ncbi:UbiA family prenyltransferase [Actinokineospora sp.]|uniref:UbiA family prenyltransferase n=1 Tax=Actinokineospora sp. TaxID=1872133 RepID=UPI004037CA52
MWQTGSALIRTAHPQAAAGVTVVAAALSASLGQSAAGVVAVVVAVFAGQLSVGWLNDLVDAPRDAQVGRAGKPLAAGEISAGVVRAAVLVSAVVAVGTSVASGWQAAVAHTVALISAWAYDLGVKSTVCSVVPFAVSFGLLTAFVTLGLPVSALPPWWLVATAALLGSAAHFANVLPDLDDDRATGVRGLPHRLGATRSRAAAAVLVLAASGALVAGLPRGALPLGLAGLVVAAVVTACGLALGRRPGSRAAFHAMLLVAVLDAAVLVAARFG